jgi:hypothetical protein
VLGDLCVSLERIPTAIVQDLNYPARPRKTTGPQLFGSVTDPAARPGNAKGLIHQPGVDGLPAALQPSIRASSPLRISIGGGGQPGMWRSTGITADTEPTHAALLAKTPQPAAQSPAATTHFGSGVAA